MTTNKNNSNDDNNKDIPDIPEMPNFSTTTSINENFSFDLEIEKDQD